MDQDRALHASWYGACVILLMTGQSHLLSRSVVAEQTRKKAGGRVGQNLDRPKHALGQKACHTQRVREQGRREVFLSFLHLSGPFQPRSLKRLKQETQTVVE